jgi:hypothetical protein
MKLTWRAVVADGEGDGRAGIDVAKAVASNSSTANLGGSFPHNLGEMTPFLEQAHVGAGLSIEVLKVTNLVVIHQVGDHDSNVVRGGTVTDVLAVSATVDASMRLLASERPTRSRLRG